LRNINNSNDITASDMLL